MEEQNHILPQETSNLTVMLVDDEDALLASARRMLHKQCILKTYNNAAAALDFLRQSPGQVDVVVSDLMMPHMDGVEFLTEARSVSPATPRVLLSGSLSESALQGAVNKAGISRVIVKPVPASTILSIVWDLVSAGNDNTKPANPMVRRMRSSLSTDHSVSFQPRVNAKNFEVSGLEALSRFPDLQKTFTVEDIITGAEDHPVIGELTFQVIDFIHTHRDAIASSFGNVPIGVNISPHSVADNKFMTSLTAFLAERPTLPNLEFEVTEQSNMAFTAAFQENLPKLRDAGYPIFLDDFGSGNNSIALLRRGQFSGLKLDKSLIMRLDDDNPVDSSFVEWATTISHQMNMTVIAEGVETLDTATYLQNIGVDELQGFYFGLPASIT
ncbi:EAL domain-containing protein [Thalassospira lohafexi]|uniref:Diguanylate phosphodiesterase n=1 Tax=Thalassospira lohafexi TaxID=744227 RepID=A0A2N3LBG3_9PROT|nr:EAL domain-containing response regulator [Thalassospira lohafexi]PKR60108.1 hypothetical protein COO92_01675 [Thalassospira lohafexi]